MVLVRSRLCRPQDCGAAHVSEHRLNTRRWLEKHSRHDGDGCLIWPFKRNRFGYGRASIDGKVGIASRYMCVLAHGDPPMPKMQAAHICGNGAGGCVNPKHLRWATRHENEADKLAHGTTNRGQRNGRSKLGPTEVLRVRAAIADGMTVRGTAALFGVSNGTVTAILSGRTWGWL